MEPYVEKWYNDSWTPENQNATLPKRISSNNAKLMKQLQVIG